MNILIIGSKGFIGSYVLEHFRSQNASTWGCDIVVDYVDKDYFQIDATNADYNSVFKAVRFDVCINCSGAASVPASIEEPHRDFLLNSVNVFKILNAIRDSNPQCRFINLSSAAVYGSPDRLPIAEDSAIKPISPYGIHKRMAEEICQEFYEIYNMPTCSLRIFSAYGEGLKKQLFWDVYHKTINTDRIELFGTGKESRDFIYIKDIALAIQNVLEQDNFFEASCINVAAGIEYEIKDVVEIFLGAVGWQGEVKFIGTERKGDPINWCADISKLNSIGFEPSVQLNDGLTLYANWVKSL